MCGIVGYYNAEGINAEDLQRLLNALRSLEKRGPDGEGAVLINTKTGNVRTLSLEGTPEGIVTDLDPRAYEGHSADLFLGHRRLSIFDLSINGHQPMRDEAGNWIILNGEVYNFIEIRDELVKKGYSFRSGTDTEVILAAYREWGPDCLSRFNGMWAFILYDAQTRKLFISNDRVGIKQLYEYRGEKDRMWASEMKAIRKVKNGSLNLNKEVAEAYLVYMLLDYNEETFFRQVKKFRPGTYLHAGVEDIPSAIQHEYWTIPDRKARYRNIDEAKEKFRELLFSSISLRMRSDVDWGTTLSGGLDSSTIIYSAKKIMEEAGIDKQINTFSAIFPGNSEDESEYIRFIEKDLNTNARFVEPIKKFNFQDLFEFIHIQDQPVNTTSMYSQYCVMREVGNSSVKVLLDGQGADELFGGYHHHFYKYARQLVLSLRFGKYRELVSDYCKMKKWDIKYVHKTILNDIKLYLKLKAGGKIQDGPEEISKWNAFSTLNSVCKFDFKTYILPSLLRYEDRNSMAFSIEARVPYLDYRIVEFALTLPEEYKINKAWQKYIVRYSFDEVPEKIRYRKDKNGFQTPHKEWIETYRNQFVELARNAMTLDIDVPKEWGRIEEMRYDSLFRLANLGILMQKTTTSNVEKV